MTLTTIHEPKQHYALVNGKKIGPFATEIDLVRRLAPKIDLRKFAHSAIGNEKHCEITWWSE